MKKVKGISIIVLIFIIIYFLQVNFFSWFNIRGIQPNLFIIFVLFLGLFIGNKSGAIGGMIVGTIMDVLVGKTIGFSGFFLALIGLLAEYFDKNFSKDNRIMIVVITAISTIFYEIAMYFIVVVQYRIDVEILPFVVTLAVETIYNILIVLCSYQLIKKVGYYLQNIFNNKEFLTRYF